MKIIKNKKEIILLLKIFLIAVLIDIVIAPLRGYVSIHSCSVVGFMLYFFYIFFTLKKYSKSVSEYKILLVCLFGSAILTLPIRIFDFQSTFNTLLDFLFHLLGIIAGYLFFKSGRFLRVIIVIVSIIGCIFIYFKGYEMWNNKTYFGTFTGRVKEETADFLFTNGNGEVIENNDLKGKYVVLDFWYKYCGSCFKDFPKVEELYHKCKQYPDFIELYSVNYKLDEDSKEYAFRTIRDEGYSFPALRIDDKQMLESVFQVYVFPAIIILDMDGDIIFRGNINAATTFVNRLIRSK